MWGTGFPLPPPALGPPRWAGDRLGGSRLCWAPGWRAQAPRLPGTPGKVPRGGGGAGTVAGAGRAGRAWAPAGSRTGLPSRRGRSGRGGPRAPCARHGRRGGDVSGSADPAQGPGRADHWAMRPEPWLWLLLLLCCPGAAAPPPGKPGLRPPRPPPAPLHRVRPAGRPDPVEVRRAPAAGAGLQRARVSGCPRLGGDLRGSAIAGVPTGRGLKGLLIAGVRIGRGPVG